MKKRTISNQIIRGLITSLVLLLTPFLASAQPPIATPDGFAGYAGTTGGGNATPVTVSSASAFKSAISGNSAAVIYVNGFLNVGNVSIGSNKTIVGITASSGIGGGKISVNGSNYIFQNLIIGPGSSDVMEVSGGNKVFITKCSFHDCGDELLSIVRQSDNVTISWCKFYFENPHDHSMGHIIGNNESSTSDRGYLHTTMHHNWYAEGVRSRMPRVAFGHVHIYNNYYNSVGNVYTIGIGRECHIRLENTHFDNVNACWRDMSGAVDGEFGWDNLIFEGCTQPTFMPNSYPVFNPPYSFSLDPVESVESIVRNGAGNVMGGVGPVSVTGVTVAPTSATVNIGGKTQLKATVSPSNATNKAVSWSSGNTSVATVSSSGVVTGVANGSATITVKTKDGGYTASCKITVSDGGSGGCNNPTAISIPFAKDGEGEFCWSTTKGIAYINSWNLEELTINGVDYTNTWSNNLPPAQNGKWIIHYIGKYSWSHFEASAAKSAEPMVSGLEKDVRIYPNPFKDGLNIDLSRSEGAKRIEVINSMGQVLEELNEGQIQGDLIKLNVGTGPGLYLIRIYNGENIISEVIVKE